MIIYSKTDNLTTFHHSLLLAFSLTHSRTRYGYDIFYRYFRCFINFTEATVASNSKSLRLIHILKMYLQL